MAQDDMKSRIVAHREHLERKAPIIAARAAEATARAELLMKEQDDLAHEASVRAGYRDEHRELVNDNRRERERLKRRRAEAKATAAAAAADNPDPEDDD